MNRTITLLLIVSLLFTLCACKNTAETSDTVSDVLTIRLQDYTYETVEGGVRIQFYKGFDEHVVIPDTIDSLPVVEIGPSAFDGEIHVETVVVPDTVTKIGYDAFKNCTLLTKVVLSDHLQELGARAFAGCTSLTDIALPDSLLFVGEDAFAGCVLLPDLQKS